MKTGIKLAALMTLAAVSCGGGEASFRIKYRFDDVLIAGVDPSQRRTYCRNVASSWRSRIG